MHEMMKNHDTHHEALSREWEKSQENPVIKGLKAGRPIAELIFNLPAFSKAFDHKLTCLDCSDGRVCTGAKMALAGEGLLLGPEDRAILEEEIKKRGLSISGHENCGAAKIAHPDASDSDAFGYDHARELARSTGSAYRRVEKDEFTSPIHNERVLVLEGTGRFDAANFNGFPAPFITSAAAFGLSREYQITEMEALTGIALGDHGFGNRFDEENPFYYVISADSEEQLDEIRATASVAASKFGSRVKVVGFVAPRV